MKTLAPWGDAPQNYLYVLIHRAKRHKPYTEIARFQVAGDCCQSNAEDHCEKQMGWTEDFLWNSREYRLVNGETWRQMQVRQHLKAVKM